jgi:hypothetical protein
MLTLDIDFSSYAGSEPPQLTHCVRLPGLLQYKHTVYLQVSTADTVANGVAALHKKSEQKPSETKAKSAAKAAEGSAKSKSALASRAGKESKKRKAAGMKEFNSRAEKVILDVGQVVVTSDGDKKMRMVDSGLPHMKKINKNCRQEQPGPECAIFTIEVGPL